MRKTITALLGLPLLWFAASALAQERACSSSDFQSCKTCAQLEAAIDLKQPNAGDYYRGAAWNGLYSAYVLNCPIIGAKLIKAGADPSSGGSSGSMILTVASKWPHNQKKINEAWAAMLLLAGAGSHKPLMWMQNKTTAELVKEESWTTPDYFDLFILFQK